MKTKIFTISALLAGLLVTAACSSEETLSDPSASASPEESLVRVMATMPGFAESRLYMKDLSTAATNPKLEIKWNEAQDDKFSVLKGSSTTTPKTFIQQPDASSPGTALQTADFTGTISVDLGATYYAVYPETTSTSATGIWFSIAGQDGTTDISQETGKKVFMYAKNSISNNSLTLTFEHLTSVLKVTLQFEFESALTVNGTVAQPASTRATGGKIKNVNFYATQGLLTDATIDITQTTVVDANGNVNYASTTEGSLSFGETTEFDLNSDGTVTFYLHVFPNEITDLCVTADDDEGNHYVACLTDQKTVAAGTMYTNEDNIAVMKSGVYVATPGTLSTLIPTSEKNTITSLKVAGQLNGADLLYLREMAGSSKTLVTTKGQLTVLDLGDASFVPSNDVYCSDSEASPSDFTITEASTIPNRAFYECNLKSIVLPKRVTKVDYWAFRKCYDLADVYCKVADPSTVSFGDIAFGSSTKENRRLFVPESSLQDYKNNSDWTYYFPVNQIYADK